MNRQFAIGKRFYELPLEEKLKYVPEGLGASPNLCCLGEGLISAVDDGKFNGYVPAGRRV